MGKAQSSLLTVEPFAVLKSQLWHRSTAVQAACPYCTVYTVKLPVPRWRVGSTLKEAAFSITLPIKLLLIYA